MLGENLNEIKYLRMELKKTNQLKITIKRIGTKLDIKIH
jgi:hypothetical protein